MSVQQAPTIRIGLVLGGGGLTGTAFHAAVIAGLAEAAGWDARDAEVIVGTSAGSTSAALMRAGLPPRDYLARVLGEPLSEEGARILGGVAALRTGARRGRPTLRPAAPGTLAELVRRPRQLRPGILAAALLPVGTRDVAETAAGIGDLFGRWPEAPTWICAIRLDGGTRVVFGRDATASMREAVSASCAIPGYFAPVVIDGRRHVDGGAWSMHNLDLVAGLGLDLAVVSAPMSTADPRAIEPGTPLRWPVRRQLDREVAMVRRSGTRVIVVAPDRQVRQVMGTTTMRPELRRPVARAARALVDRLVGAGQLRVR